MKNRPRVSFTAFIGPLAGLGLLAGVSTTHAADAHHPEPVATAGSVQVSPALLELLRAEMREIAAGVQAMALSIAIGDWRAVHDTSAKIQASYVMNRKLTAAQRAELERLPELFRHMDAQFHRQAGKAAVAAAAHDAEQVVFQYARMLESCTACHAAFARPRFRGFEPEPAAPHHH